MARRVYLVCVCAVVFTLLPLGASGQTVVGAVVETGTLRPLTGAFVTLENRARERVAGRLAAEDGSFHIRAPARGEYRLVARLIGYADATSDFFTLAEGESLERTLEVSVRPVSLEGIRAEAGRRCYERPGSGPQTARLWEEARKALEIVDWTESEAALRFRIVEHVRELDARSLRVSAIREQGRAGWYKESPYRSIPVNELDSNGYIQPAPGGYWDYFGPDAEVLLSEHFLETHCFRVAEVIEADLVGLTFEPVRGRTHPEISGVLWLDRGTAELRRVDFTYLNPPYPYREWEQVGGRVEFERLATGMWVVWRWYVRMPLEVRRTGGYRGEPTEVDLASLKEEGAEITEVRTASGEMLARATGATLYGVVADSTTGAPLASASVEVLATGIRTTAGPDGAYRLSGLPTGTFAVRVSHPDLELLGGEPPEREVRLEAGRATRLAVTPSLSELARVRCISAAEFSDPVMLYGRVRDPADTAAVPGVLVRVFTGTGEERVISDSTGGYVVCLEREGPVAVAAVALQDGAVPRHSLPLKTLEIGSGPLARRDIYLSPDALAVLSATATGDPLLNHRVAHRGSQWTNSLNGTVVRHSDGRPVSGATVVLRSVDEELAIHSSFTNEEGRFRFMHPDLQTREFELSVEHVAYGRVSEVVKFPPAKQLDIEVVLTERPLAVAPIVVTERRRGFLVDETGLYERVARGAGLVIERDEIERSGANRITDLMHGRAGWIVITSSDGKQDLRLSDAHESCPPVIWVDGGLVRAGIEGRTSVAPAWERRGMQIQLSELLAVEEVEAIELHQTTAELPAHYAGTGGDCGVVLLWTRRENK